MLGDEEHQRQGGDQGGREDEEDVRLGETGIGAARHNGGRDGHRGNGTRLPEHAAQAGHSGCVLGGKPEVHFEERDDVLGSTFWRATGPV